LDFYGKYHIKTGFDGVIRSRCANIQWHGADSREQIQDESASLQAAF